MIFSTLQFKVAVTVNFLTPWCYRAFWIVSVFFSRNNNKNTLKNMTLFNYRDVKAQINCARLAAKPGSQVNPAFPGRSRAQTKLYSEKTLLVEGVLYCFFPHRSPNCCGPRDEPHTTKADWS